MLLSAVPSSFLSLLLFLFISHMRRQGNYNRRCLSHYNSLVAAGAFEASRTSTITIFAISTRILFFFFFFFCCGAVVGGVYLSLRRSICRSFASRTFESCARDVILFVFTFLCRYFRFCSPACLSSPFLCLLSLSLSLPSSIFLERKLFRQRFFRNNNLLSVAGSTKIFLRASKSHRLHPSTSSWTDVPGDSNDLPRKGVSHQVFPVRRPTKSS